MFWFFSAIAAYFFSALVAIVDKYLLAGPLPHPRVYAFYVGIFGGLALFLIPLGFLFPDTDWFIVPAWDQIAMSLVSGALFVYALYWFFKGLYHFEASRIVTAVGGLNPIFILAFILIFILLEGGEFLDLKTGLAFVLLVLGTIIISFKRGRGIDLKSIKISSIAAFLFASSFFLAHLVYQEQSFISGFIWLRIGGIIPALLYLLSKETREVLFMKQVKKPKQIFGLFMLGQLFGGASAILQNLAIAFVPITFLAFVIALEGTKYIFVLLIAFFFSFRFPKILKEEFSKEAIFQKGLAVLLISLGIILLANQLASQFYV